MPRPKRAPVPIPDADPPIYSVQDVAAHLGVSDDTVYRLVSGKKIRHVQVGKVIRFRLSHVQAYDQRATKREHEGQMSGAAKAAYNAR